MKRTVLIGSRGSDLALVQSRTVQALLASLFPGILFKIVVIHTRGDRDRIQPLFKLSGAGIFTSEIERALIAKKIDMAVHSLKDLPTELPSGLRIGAYLSRGDSRDVLVTKSGAGIKDLKFGARVGTSSLRRERQLRLLRDDLKVVPIRGNVPTRIKKVLSNQVDAVVLARAGIHRLGGYERYCRVLEPSQMVPPAGQGILGVEIRSEDSFMSGLLQRLNSPKSEREALAERLFLKTLRGGCRVPIGVWAHSQGKKMRLHAVVCSPKSSGAIWSHIEGPSDDPRGLAKRLAKSMLERGAGRFLDQARPGWSNDASQKG